MMRMTLRKGSLVLYKERPARVAQTGEKIEIELKGNQTLKVRPKDVTILHPGPLEHLDELQPQAGEVETAWEILAGKTITLAELAELIYGAHTPITAWAAWQLVTDGLYFQGTPKQVVARLPEEVAREQSAREAKAAEKQAWAAFLDRVKTSQIATQDYPFLRDVEALALGRQSKSRLLRELGRTERPENAHALLLELGHWDETVNPYPSRLGLDTSLPKIALPELPEEDRVDLTHLPAFAIDDEGTQDPDDALSLDSTSPRAGLGRLWVHVADVAALVSPKGKADLEARARGANLYLPEGTVPMLPPQATQMLGLGKTEVSPALSFCLDLDSAGEIVDVKVVSSWVRVTRLTYAEAELRLGQEPFKSLYRLSQIYQAHRYKRGAVSIDLPEVKIRVDNGQVTIRPLPPLRSRTLVTEVMLMAGEAAARFAVEHDIPFPFSTQDPSLPRTPEPAEGLAEMYALRHMLKPSQIKIAPAPHNGLGLEIYARATSPLRRYLDLVVHQQLRAYLCDETPLETQEVLERIGAAEAVAGSVRQTERLARRHWTLVYLLERPDWCGEGVLVEKRGSRCTVLIPELDLDPRVHMRADLPLNSSVSLSLIGVNLVELHAHFRVQSGAR